MSGRQPESEEPAGKPWPKPVRYAVLILLGAFIGVGLVTLLYSRGFLPIAGPFVALFLGPLFVFLGLLVRRQRLVRRSRELAADLERLQTQVETERAVAPGARPTGATDAALDRVADVARLAGQRLAWGQELSAAEELAELAAYATREWPSGAPLTAGLRRIAERAEPIARAARRASRTGR